MKNWCKHILKENYIIIKITIILDTIWDVYDTHLDEIGDKNILT